MLNKNIKCIVLSAVLIVTAFSCHSQEKGNRMDKKETEIIESYFSKSNFKNTQENFNKVNAELLGIQPETLQNGYNDLLIFNEPTNYQISREGEYIKIGNDILPDLDSVREKVNDNLKYPYFEEVTALNKIIYQDDLTSILQVAFNNADLAADIVILFDYEKNENLLQSALKTIGNWEDIEESYKLAFVFYNHSYKIREKLLRKLQPKDSLLYALTFYLADNQQKIIASTSISRKNLEKAIAFLLQIGFENKEEVDIQTDMSYELLHNIYVSYPELTEIFKKNSYFGYDDLEKYTQEYKILQDDIREKEYGEIQDPDGYANVREEKNTSSQILQQVKSGEKVEILDNSGDWLLIQSGEGKKGYVHKSRIKRKL